MILTQKTSDQNTKFHKNTPAVFMPSRTQESADRQKQTYRQTDGRTDGQTDRNFVDGGFFFYNFA